jgi:flavin reductase (DIM6/NTAB) family NADH-FMN oxidoreductase RutF
MSAQTILPATVPPELSLLPSPAVVVDAVAYRAAFRAHAGGVTVITADAGKGPVGFTATSVVSVSLTPPMVSFALSNNSSSFATLASAQTVVINFLDLTQAELAGRFAARGVDRFTHPTQWSRLDDGTPVLDDAPSFLHGRIEHRFAVGDHHIIVVALQTVTQRRSYAPLVYHAGSYGTATIPD